MQRIQLGNTVFEGRNNAYLLQGERPTLVDTGVATPGVREELQSGLGEHGLGFADLDQVVLTHWHPDHAGLAGDIQAAGGATVRVHAADAPMVAGDGTALADENDLMRRRLDEWGLPAPVRAELLDYLDSHENLRGQPADVTPLADGDRLQLGDRTAEVVHLPGHAAGLSAFALDGPAGREAFVGDALLPKYTPNVGGADVRVDSALAKYADSLVRLAGLELDRAWPGHRDPITDPTGRAAAILEHHRDRTRRVVGVLEAHGPCDAWTVSAHLFGDLAEIHILHGPGEAFAHLDHLAAAGVAARESADGGDGDAPAEGERVVYRLVQPTPDVESLFPRLPADTKH